MAKTATLVNSTDGDLFTPMVGQRCNQTMSSSPIKFLVLGPTEARQGGNPIALSGARRQALVTRLLLDAGRSVSAETLLEDVWDGHAPPAASATLQSHVSQLRKVIGPRLQRSTTGYMLRLDAASVTPLSSRIVLLTVRRTWREAMWERPRASFSERFGCGGARHCRA
jgi:Transcriptional regulatory protein, C terminal